MAEQLNNIQICRNGHQQSNADSRFCIYCGISLNAPPVQPVVSQQPPPPINQQFNNGQVIQQPVNPTGYQPSPNPNNYPQPNQFAQPVQNQFVQPVQNQFVLSATKTPQCQKCGGDGQRLEPHVLVCQECNWLRPLVPGYGVDCSAFQWAEDGKAMSVLRAIKPLHATAQAISNKVGRRWVEIGRAHV